MNNSNALIIISDGVEELEAIASIDCLRRAGVSVTVASPSESVTGRNQIRIIADASIDACMSKDYDLIVIPGGPSHKAMAEDQRILELLSRQNSAGRLIGSICAGPVVLMAAGVLEGKAFTSFPLTQDQLPQRDPDRQVVRDGNLITSQGAGTAIAFAIALVEAICGRQTAEDIAASICYRL